MFDLGVNLGFRPIRALFVAFCLLAFFGCDLLKRKVTRSGENLSQSALYVNSPLFGAAMKVISARCISCHRMGGSASDFTSNTSNEQKWISSGSVVAGQPADSLLYRYLSGSGLSPGGMPLMAAPLSTDDLNTIRDWITELKESSSAPGTGESGGAGASGVLMMPSQNFFRVGDRNSVKSILDGIFGPSAGATTTSLVSYSLSTFGGTCDPMGAPPVSGDGGDVCPSVDVTSFSGPIVPGFSATRAGQTVKACNSLAFNDSAIQFAILKATQRTNLTYLDTTPVPSAADLLAAYHLFYPGQVPPSAVTAALAAVANAARTVGACPAGSPPCQLDPWRYVILTLCYAPDWQAP